MACSQSYFFLSLVLLFSILCINHTALCDDEEENLLRGINNYRANLKLSALTENDKAECLAEEIADTFKNQRCTNTTGPNTVPGTEPQFSDYPDLLAKCNLNVTTSDGVILPACVPNLVQDVVLSSYTQTQYSGSLNDSKYTGIGIGSDDNWIVVILTTNTSTVYEDEDEEENLFRGINNYRANLKLSTLTENDKAECLAEEIADTFKNQRCTNTTGPNATVPQFSDYPNLLAKCNLNVTTSDGVILPACVPNLVQDVVLSSYTQTQYSGSLNDSKYTGIGIGSDDNWIVVILTTNTSTGGFAVGSSDSNNFGSKLGPVHPMLFLLTGLLFLMVAN